jgi:peptidoglycan/xylan/chitin deacetylase (PgdA/CDA1 family)
MNWRDTKRSLHTGLARTAHVTGTTALAMKVQHVLHAPYLRAVNYHWTPRESADRLERHFRFYAQEFECLTRSTLDDFFVNGATRSGRPALIVSFDDGYRNHSEVAAELLDRHNIKGWFFVIARGCRTPQSILRGNLNTDYLMKWAEVRELQNRGHAIGCHTLSHCNVGTAKSVDLQAEIVDARNETEAELGRRVDSFCFPFGTSDSYSDESVALIVQNYRLAFNSFPGPIRPTDSPFGIGRIPVEPEWKLDDIRFRLAGLMDMRYRRDRRKYIRCVAACLDKLGANQGVLH